MAIEAGQSHDRELMTNKKQIEDPIFFHGTIPLPDAVMLTEATFYQSAKEVADSGLTRKRSREFYSMPQDSAAVSQMMRLSSLLERESASQQREFDSLIALNTQKLVALEERAKQRLVMAVKEAMETKIREKDEEIEMLSKLNWALQERVKSLCVKNNLWRGLAQSNEAVANSLRTDLERVLTSPGIVEDRKSLHNDDAESCCGSSEEGNGMGGCRGCGGRREVGVLVMPCRHVCLCKTCGSNRESCPICGSAITASIHVNVSSSS